MFAAFVLVASTHFAALLSPGPDFFLLVRAALLRGRRQADGVAAGIALANLLSMLLVLGLLASVPDSAHSALRWLQALGGLYFLRRSATSRPAAAICAGCATACWRAA